MATLTHLLIGVIFICILPSASCEPKRPPNYHHENMPDTPFSCEEKVIGGYYADIDAECQMFHVCVQVDETDIRDFKFMCPNDTVFDQENFICANWFDVDCSLSVKWYPKLKSSLASNSIGGLTESPYENQRRAQQKQKQQLQEIYDEQSGRLKEHELFLKETQRASDVHQEKTLREHERQNTETLKQQLRQLQKQQEYLEQIDQRPVGRRVPSGSKDVTYDDYYSDNSSTLEYDYYYYDYDSTNRPSFYKYDEYEPNGRIVEPVENIRELPVMVSISAKKSTTTIKPSTRSSKSKPKSKH
ncbi:uncharacterized protein LOC136033128 isoform X2 [Artemia franciscana]|uniref:Chitin-binding type-2 domain-containing protein n=2 Tax=Artemia franciscana TaxID=6661 RepID=A0AA88IEF3_ARTSF|nr:hypothetical protein QYM36_001562 [Artemia franciscana]